MRKYIVQQTYDDFVYPNNNIAIYDVNDVVQNINSSGVTGTVSGFTATLSGATMTIGFSYDWIRNGAEVFINSANRLHLFSVHMMTPTKTYYKPWRLVDYKYITGATPTNSTGSFTTSVTESAFGEAFTSGVYSFEIRFIGALQNYIVTQQTTNVASSPSPTPTRTMTPTPSVTSSPGSSTSPTPTMTVTPTRTLTPTPTNTPGLTPSATPPGSYFTYNITTGYPSSIAACLDGTAVTQIYGAVTPFLDNSIFYTTPYLSTPYAGGSSYYKNTATNEYVQIDNSGNNISEGTC
jgi:hypothetical protein